MYFIINIYIIVSEYSELFVRIILSKASEINVGIQNIVNCWWQLFIFMLKH